MFFFFILCFYFFIFIHEKYQLLVAPPPWFIGFCSLDETNSLWAVPKDGSIGSSRRLIKSDLDFASAI